MAEETEEKKPAAKKTSAAAGTAKKSTAAKKPAARKPAARKTSTAKKPAAKKPAAKKAAAPRKTAAPKAAASKPASATKTEAAAEPKAAKQKAEAPKDTPHQEDAGAKVDKDAIIAELKEKDWLEVFFRGIFMLGYGVLASVVLWVTFALAVVQFVVMVLTGKPNASITRFIRGCAKYIEDVLDFLSFRTDEKPFPLGKDIPDGN